MLKELFEQVIVYAKRGEENEDVRNHFIWISSSEFLEHDGNDLSLHDCFIKQFSQKRNGNTYDVRLEFNAFVYHKGNELGKQRFILTFNTRTKLQVMTHKEIYAFGLFRPNQEMGFIFHNNGSLDYLAFQYENLHRVVGAFTSY